MDGRLAEAFAAVPRRAFLPERQHPLADIDQALDIGYGVTNSQPSTVRDMLALLAPRPGDRVLDVGSGSGWTTALIAHLVGPGGLVLGVERIPELVASSRAAVAGIVPDDSVVEGAVSQQNRQGVSRIPPSSVFGAVEIHEAEPGVLGWPARAPYDRVLVSAAADELPRALLDQLTIGGVLVVPVQGVMLKVTRTTGEPEVERHGRYVFVPLIQ